jgi:predicted nucleic acid-binding protein
VIVLDACVVIAFFDPANRHHDAAVAILSREDRLAMSVLSVAEFLVHPARAGQCAAALEGIRQLGIDIHPLAAEDARDLAETRAGTGLRMPDATIVHLARRLTAGVATFDQALAAQATHLGLPVVDLQQGDPVELEALGALDVMRRLAGASPEQDFDFDPPRLDGTLREPKL